MPLSEARILPQQLTREEAAAVLGVRPNTLGNYVRQKRLLPTLETRETRGRGRVSLFHTADVLELRDEVAAWKAERAEGQAIQDGKKKCSKCKERVPVSRFEPCRATKSGLQSWCMDCVNRNGAKWHQRNKPKRHQQKRDWYKAHPEVLAAQKKRSYERNREKVRAYLRDWYRKNAAYARAYRTSRHRARQEGKKNPRAYLAFLVQLVGVKSCPACRRLLSLQQFDRHGRTIDGWSVKCFECLPPRKTLPGGDLLEMDRKFKNTADSYTRHDVLADKTAVDPEQAAMEGLLWEFVDTLPETQQTFLMAFLETLDVAMAAAEVGISQEEAGALLLDIRTLAHSSLTEVL